MLTNGNFTLIFLRKKKNVLICLNEFLHSKIFLNFIKDFIFSYTILHIKDGILNIILTINFYSNIKT